LSRERTGPLSFLFGGNDKQAVRLHARNRPNRVSKLRPTVNAKLDRLSSGEMPVWYKLVPAVSLKARVRSPGQAGFPNCV